MAVKQDPGFSTYIICAILVFVLLCSYRAEQLRRKVFGLFMPSISFFLWIHLLVLHELVA